MATDSTTDREPARGRRGFLELLAACLLALPILGPLLLALKTTLAPAKRSGPRLLPTIPLSEIGEDAITWVPLQWQRWHGAFLEQVHRMVMLRRSGSEVIALSPECPHLGCNVHYRADQRDFLCPCHAGRFDLNGQRLEGPPPGPLHRYRVEVPSDPSKPVQVEV